MDAYRRDLEAFGADRTIAVGTSALRDAENGEVFLRAIELRYGISTHLVRGSEEADLTFRGVRSEGRLIDDTLVVDIGGGSTELTLGGDAGPVISTSLQLGCLRLTERFLESDPPTAGELERSAADVRDQLSRGRR